MSTDNLLQLAAGSRRPDWYRLLLEYGVKQDHTERYGGVWDSIMCSDFVNDTSKRYESLTIDTYRLLWDSYEERPWLIDFISRGGAYSTSKRRWATEAVWLFRQSQFHLFGSELSHFRYALLKGTFTNFIWDANLEGLLWMKDILHTQSGAQLFEDLQNGNFNLLRTFFGNTRLVRPRNIGVDILSALSLFGVDVDACMAREFLRFPLDVVECCWPGERLKKTVTFSNQGASGYTLGWDWNYVESAPGYLLVSELPALTVDSDMKLNYDDENPHLRHENGPLYVNRHDRAKIFTNTGVEKWPPRFKRRAAKKERKELARLGQKPTRTKMPGSWVP